MLKTLIEVKANLIPKNQAWDPKYNTAILAAIADLYAEILAKETVEEITTEGTTTLTSDDSGKTFILISAAGQPIVLPEAESALKFKFIVGLAFATTNWTITSPETNIQGNVVVVGAHVAGADEDTITFVASAESIGDYVEVVSDGTNWYVSGSGVLSGSITLTDES